jgi:energy-coupling factor transporter ATP-binding protein EcfA2
MPAMIEQTPDKLLVDRATLAKRRHQFSPGMPGWVPQWMAQRACWGFHDETKRPLTPARGQEGGDLKPGGQTVEDRHRWLPFPLAIKLGEYKLSKGRQIGLSFFLGEGVGGIDLDKVRDPETGNLTTIAHQVYRLAAQLGAYVEISPSGTGFKIYGLLGRVFREDRSSLSIPMGTVTDDQGQSLTSSMEFECWLADRHFCVTGRPIGEPGSTEPVRLEPILELIESLLLPTPAPEAQPPTNPEEAKLCQEITGLMNQPVEDGESIGKWFNRLEPRGIGAWLIQGLGWQFHSEESTCSHWTRPGKDPRAGSSGTLYFDRGIFQVFSPNGNLTRGAHSLFDLYKIAFHAGDGRLAARTLGDWKRAGALGSVPISPVSKPPVPAALAQPQPPKPPSNCLGRGTSLAELRARYGALEWVWKDWIAKGTVHLVTGDSGAGKTTVLADILINVHNDGRLPDGSQASMGRGQKILVVDSDVRAHRQLADLVGKYDPSPTFEPFHVFELLDRPAPRTATNWEDHEAFFAILAQTIREGNYWALVVDTVSRFAGSSRLEVVNELTKFVTPLNIIARDLGIPIFLVGHANASGSAMGRHLVGACDIGWKIGKRKGGGDLTCARSQGAPPEPGCWRFRFSKEGPLEWIPQRHQEPEDGTDPAPGEDDDSAALEAWVVEFLGVQKNSEVGYYSNTWGQLFRAAIDAGKITEKNKSTMNRAVNRLHKAGAIVEVLRPGFQGRLQKHYELPQSTQSD